MIFNTKLYKPKINNEIIVRTRLSSIIESNIEKTTTFVIAPTGYGKSVLVSQWLEHNSKYYCWLSIDDELNNADSFFKLLLFDLSRKFPSLFSNYSDILFVGELPPINHVKDFIIDQLNSINENFVIVLDDYHIVTDPQINHFIDELINSAVQKIHTVIISRAEPDLNICRLRAFGLLNEIGINELKFGLDEVQEFVSISNSNSLPNDIVVKILEYTEGWIVGIRMALIYYTKKNISNFDAGFKLDKPYFKEYLLGETFSLLSKQTKKMLLISALSGKFCCDLLIRIYADSGYKISSDVIRKIFNQLIAESQFIIALDDYGKWFRFHHFYYDFLNDLLIKSCTKGEVRFFHKSASKFFEKEKNYYEAVKHAVSANDIKLVVSLFKKYKHILLNSDQFTRLEKFLELIPEKWLISEPEILATRIFFHDSNGDYAAMKKDTERFCEIVPYRTSLKGDAARLWGEVKVSNASLLFLSEQIDESLAVSQDALNKLPDEACYMRDVASFLKLLSLQTKGKQSVAEEEFKRILDAIPLSEKDKRIRTYAHKAMLNTFLGELDESISYAIKSIKLLKDSKLYVSAIYVNYFYHTAFYLKNDFSEEHIHYSTIDKYIYTGRPFWGLNLLISKGYLLNAIGDKAKLDAIIRQLHEFANNYAELPILSIVKTFELDIGIINNDINKAKKLSFEANFNPYPPFSFAFFPQLVQIKLWLYFGTQSKLQKAKKKLSELINFGIRTNRINLLLAAKPVESLTYYLLGDEDNCLATLEEALNISQEKGYVRNFLDVGCKMQTVIEYFIHLGFKHPYLDVIHHNFMRENIGKRFVGQSNAKDTYINPLTGKVTITIREVKLLKMLLRDMQNKEIAEEVGISTDSVKKSLYRLYKKLGVNSRTDAIYKSIESGLLKIEMQN